MNGQRQSEHWEHSRERFNGPDSAVLDPNTMHETVRGADAGATSPLPKDPITGVKYGLFFSVAIWAFLLSLGVAIFR
ncbi:MAG: hypothetical protein AAGA61_06170 [Pseudomonadota bacterium]